MSKDVPLWFTVVLTLIPSVVAVAAIVAAELRDRRNMKAAREAQYRELEERRWTTLRDERREAYMAYMDVCDRIHGGDHSPEARAELRKIIEVIELVSLSKEVQDSVRELTNHLILRINRGETEAVSLRDESAYRALRGKFRKAIQRDLGITPAALDTLSQRP